MKYSFFAKTVLQVDEPASRLIFILTINKIKISNIYIKDKKCYLTIKTKDIILFEKVAKEYNFSFIKINEYGLIYRLERLFSRWGFIGAVCFCAVIFFISDLFTVKLNLIDEKDDPNIKSVVEKYYKKTVNIINEKDIFNLKSELENVDSVSFVNVYKDGMSLNVEITYELEKGNIFYPKETGDIKSNSDAIVTRVICLSGTSVVEAEQSVKKGDTLIKSSVDINGTQVQTPAVGCVYGKVFYSDVCYLDKQVEQDCFTGKQIVLTEIIPLFKIKESDFDLEKKIPFEKYTVQTEQCILKSVLPFCIKRYIIKEIKTNVISQDIKNELNAIVFLLKQKCIEKIDGDYVLLDQKTKITEEADRFKIETWVETERRIDGK